MAGPGSNGVCGTRDPACQGREKCDEQADSGSPQTGSSARPEGSSRDVGVREEGREERKGCPGMGTDGCL